MVPSGVIAIPHGLVPTVMAEPAVLVASVMGPDHVLLVPSEAVSAPAPPTPVPLRVNVLPDGIVMLPCNPSDDPLGTGFLLR